MELICGACHGRLLAELPGTTVACPHCGTHLQTPAVESATPAEASIMFDAGEGDAGAVPNPDTDTVRMDFWVPPIEKEPAGAAEAFGAVLTSADVPAGQNLTPGSVAGEAPTAPPTVEPVPAVILAESGDPAAEDADNSHKTTVVGFVVATESLDSSNSPDAGATPPAPVGEESSPNNQDGAVGVFPELATVHSDQSLMESAVPLTKQTIRSVRSGVSPLAFKLLLSYASAVTIACGYLLWVLSVSQRTLDLPDLVPPTPPKGGKTNVRLFKWLPPEKEVPVANILRLGESRRFGSILVTPLRVTRGPIEFEYFDRDSEQRKDSEGPVLKLHLQFANVSKDQEFVPLDSTLVFTKELDKKKAYGLFFTNNFVCNVSERAKRAAHVLVFDQSPDSPWLIKGQNLDRELRPGEVLNTYIATTPEQIETLEGDLVWRVHFRKGYNPKSLRGVTTLIEVLFRSSEIVDDDPPASPNAEDRKEGEPGQQPAEEKPNNEPEPGSRKPAVKDA